MPRQEFSVAVQKAASRRANGYCEHPPCGQPFAGRRPEFHHVKEDFYEGEPTIENCWVVCPPCHKWLTAQAAPIMAKVRRIEKKAAGIKRKGRPMPGSKRSPYKMRLTSEGPKAERR